MATPRNILITGASSGIGEALALEYGGRGAHVAILARRAKELEAVAERVRARGGKALPIVLDVADPVATFEAVKRVDRELGGLDLVVANAGLGTNSHAARLSWEEASMMIDVNVKGAMATLLAAVPIMLAAQRGHLVGVSSLAGKRALPQSGAYCASKAALSVFLETLRLDLAPAGISVTDVQPGFVATPMTVHNTHPMPGVWTPERAAKYIADKLERAPTVVSFPWPLALVTSLMRAVPAWIYDRVTRALRGQ